MARDPTPLRDRNDGLSVADAAAQEGVHPQTIRSWIRDGHLPVSRFGPNPRYARIRIHPDDLRRAAGSQPEPDESS